jgi:hypothetical protein
MLQTLERAILDPISELPAYQVPTNRPLEVTGLRAPSPEGHGIFLVEHSYPRPDSTATYAASRDSQGEAKFGKPKFANRKIPIKVYITEATGVGAMTNLITNPAGEIGTKWLDGPDFPCVREMGTAAIPSLAGEFRDKHSFDGTFSSGVVGSIAYTFPAAGTYVISCFVWIPSNWDGGKVRLNAQSYTGQVVTFGAESDLSKRDQWQRVWSTVKVEAADLVGTMTLGAVTPPSSAPTGIIYSDAMQLEAGTAPSPWCYGDTPGCEWNGAPNASTSTRYGSGSDRKRFLREWYELQEKIEKLSEEGGTYKRVLPDGSWMVFDVLDADFVGNWEKRFNQGQEEFAFELTCKPGARLEPVTLTAHEEKTLPILVFTEAVIPGNMPALGDLMIEDIQNVNRKFCAVSVASRFLDTSANGEVLYQAENRLPLGLTAKAAGSGTPSGTETNKVLNSILFNTYAPLMSLRSSAGVYPTHVGAQRVFARVLRPEANTGTVSLRLEYAQGDLLRWRQLEPVTLAANTLEGNWEIVDLGIVKLNMARIGTQRWEGRLTGKSTTNGVDNVQIDWIAIMPAEEFYGEARALTIPPGTSGYQIGSDSFNTSNAALTGLESTLGGKWTGAGSTHDFTEVITASPGHITRNLSAAEFDASGAMNDPPIEGTIAATGRYCRIGTGVQADVTVKCPIVTYPENGGTSRGGVFARWVNLENQVIARLVAIPSGPFGFENKLYLEVWKAKAGVWTKLAGVGYFYWVGATPSISLHVGADGTGYASLVEGNVTAISCSWLADADLATGGTLQTGGYGVFHVISTYSGVAKGPSKFSMGGAAGSFVVYAGAEAASDSVIYSGKELRIRWDGTFREAEDGSGNMADVGIWEGDRLLIPQSGRENRPVRIAVLTSRNIPEQGYDQQADDTKAVLTITPRVIEVAQPS